MSERAGTVVSLDEQFGWKAPVRGEVSPEVSTRRTVLLRDEIKGNKRTMRILEGVKRNK